MNKMARQLIDDLRLYGVTSHGADVRFLDRIAVTMVERALREAAGEKELVPAGPGADEFAMLDDQRRLKLLMG